MKRLLFVVGLVGLLLSACAQGAAIAPPRDTPAEGGSYRVITALELKSMLQNKDFLLINVHIPYAGEIEGTDLFVPYNEIEQDPGKLPAGKGAGIVVYCQSGMMSSIAARSLTNLGYTNVLDLSGGMIAWQKAGYQLVKLR